MRIMKMKQRIILILLSSFIAVGTSPLVAQEGLQRTKAIRLTADVTKAINRSLKFMSDSQNPNGSFGKGSLPAATSLVLMSFMLQGHIPGEGKYGKHMVKAVDYLLSIQKNGYFHDETSRGMYEHALVVLGLSEVWGQSPDPRLRDALKQGVNVILNAQNAEGGWRYAPRPYEADVSCSAMQVVALASAKEAGIAVPHKTLKRAAAYFAACEVRSTGGFSYQLLAGAPMGGADFARSAAATLALMLGGQRKHPAARGGIAYVSATPEVSFNSMNHYFYGHYYGAQVMYQAGDKYFNRYYTKISKALLAQQNKEGMWGAGGRTDFVKSSFAVLILGIPYRFLPIYQK